MTDQSANAAPATHAFQASSPWPAWAAILATMAIVLTAIVVTAAVGQVILQLTAGPGAGLRSMTQAQTMAGMLLMQALMVLLAWWLSGWFGGNRLRVLSMVRPATVPMFLAGLAGMALILVPYNLAIYTLWPKDFTTDLRPFADLAKSDAAWIAALVVAIGAPLSEEILFRGFLLPALARSPAFGFWGAALFSTLGWTLMHWGYSAVGLVEVFVVGIYFCWLMWRYGSLWLAIALHAFYNAAQFIVLTQVTLPQPV